jgi:alpha-L-fucosidase
LAVSIDRTGLVEKSHEIVYQQLGDWVRSCYGQPVASRNGVVLDHRSSSSNQQLVLRLPQGVTLDRIMIQEDIVWGQRIRNYTLSMGNGDVLVSDGTSVGRKHIHILPQSLTVEDNNEEEATLVLTVTQSIAPPHIQLLGVFAPCYPDNDQEEHNLEATASTQ